jgi:hypothetical protein
MTPEQCQVDSSFERCPIAAAAGIPLFVKNLSVPGKQVENGGRYIIVRMMSEPTVGVAPLRWNFGGIYGPAPPVLVARSDSVPFTIEDWNVLDDFEMKMLDDGPRSVTRQDFISFVKAGQYGDATVALEALFPEEKRVRAVGLKVNTKLNKRLGQSTGHYAKGRVAVQFDGLDKVFGVKPGNLVRL